MKVKVSFVIVISSLFISCLSKKKSDKAKTTEVPTKEVDSVKTTVQSSVSWRPTVDIRSDAVMVYGTKGNPSEKSDPDSFEARVESWRDKGYNADFMTGIAWGEYKDYFTGDWDGEKHLDEGQVTKQGDTIWHGDMVPYIVPSENYLNYIKEEHIKRVIDVGITSIFIEEPEFWARSGYSESFKQEWKDYYGFDWRPPHKTPEDTYLANKLKYKLYQRAIGNVCTFAKSYGKKKGVEIKCYVATHSLVNYSQWKIVSPEASLASLDAVDGYIAQVWTGTAREPNYFKGKKKERTFETAFLEYGSMQSMTSSTGRKMFFLTDPVEDNANKDWNDYKENYEATFTAQLLYPNVANYEVMPWPERIYEGKYKTNDENGKKEKIPESYSSQMQVMINSLNHMPQTNDTISGSIGISIMMSNSLMFQRYPTHSGYKDPELSDFYGLSLPLLKRGIPVETVHMENLDKKETLKNTKVLLMTYSNMKPMNSESHKYIAHWVKNGGTLLYSGTDGDPFQDIQEWWNKKDKNYQRPSDHLFELMNISNEKPEEGLYKYGDGTVCILREDPKEYVTQKDNDKKFVNKVRGLYEKNADGKKLKFKNNFYLQRGPYDIIAVMDESVGDSSFMVEGHLMDLYDPELSIYNSNEIHPGEQELFLNLDRVENKEKPQILAAASRSCAEKSTSNSYTYTAKSPKGTTNVSRIMLPREPKRVLVNDENKFKKENWDSDSKTYFLKFENAPDGVSVKFKW